MARQRVLGNGRLCHGSDGKVCYSRGDSLKAVQELLVINSDPDKPAENSALQMPIVPPLAHRPFEVSMSETALVRQLMTHWSESGMRLFRNQVGSYQLPDGRWLSSGLCVGSSDLIGWTPVIITQEMVGKPVAVFTAIECKVGQRDTTTQQARFLAVVKQAGGLAVVARDVKDVAVELAKLLAT